MEVPNTGAYEVKSVGFSATSDGDNTLIAAVVGKRLRVLSFVLTATAAGDIVLKDSSATLATFSLGINGGVSYAGGITSPAFETGAGLALTVTNPTSVDTKGFLVYQEIA